MGSFKLPYIYYFIYIYYIYIFFFISGANICSLERTDCNAPVLWPKPRSLAKTPVFFDTVPRGTMVPRRTSLFFDINMMHSILERLLNSAPQFAASRKNFYWSGAASSVGSIFLSGKFYQSRTILVKM